MTLNIHMAAVLDEVDSDIGVEVMVECEMPMMDETEVIHYIELHEPDD